MVRGDPHSDRPALLVIDSSYTLSTIRRLGLEQSVYTRDLDGFFRRVWTVHPFGELSDAGALSGTGPPEEQRLNRRHSFIEAKPGRFGALSRLFPINFALAQAGLIWHLRRLIRNERISLVRAGDPLYLGLLGWIVAKSTGIRFVIRVNGNNDKIRENTGKPIFPRLLRSVTVEKAIERFVFKHADLIVAPNQDNIDFAIANGADSARVSIFRYGNLLAPGHLVEPTRRSKDRALFERIGVEPGRYLLCVSRLQELKFPDDAIRCLAAARSRGHDVKLVLAGEGAMLADLERLVDRLSLTAHVIFAGNIQQDWLQQLYAQAAVVISPLTGRALSEAALGGAPIAAYDLDWQGDLIQTGRTGELVPFRDVDALGEAVIKLMSDRSAARELGKAVRARALDMLHPGKLNAHERAVYATLLGMSGEQIQAPVRVAA